jgi:H+/Na+-translocating ferredoxin:NAD+ oxidoreductase subunit G
VTSKDIIKITLNLVIIYVVGGLILAAVYAKTEPVKVLKAYQEKQAALKEMMPEAKEISKMGVWKPHDKEAEYYIAKKDGKTIGYIIETYAKGYSSYIDMLIAVNDAFTVEKLNILEQHETPGLGDEVQQPYFQNQFAGKTLAHLVVVKVPTKVDIQAVSGATISSRAVTDDGVKKAVEMLKDKLSSEVKNEQAG